MSIWESASWVTVGGGRRWKGYEFYASAYMRMYGYVKKKKKTRDIKKNHGDAMYMQFYDNNIPKKTQMGLGILMDIK